MLSDFRHRLHPRGILLNAIERTFLTTGTLVIVVVFLLILFFGVYFKLA